MTQEHHPRDEQSNAEADERRDQEPDGTSEDAPSGHEIIPGNVGSFDDVPADLMRESDVVDDDEA